MRGTSVRYPSVSGHGTNSCPCPHQLTTTHRLRRPSRPVQVLEAVAAYRPLACAAFDETRARGSAPPLVVDPDGRGHARLRQPVKIKGSLRYASARAFSRTISVNRVMVSSAYTVSRRDGLWSSCFSKRYVVNVG